MKKFHFNLEKLLTYKGQILESELTTLGLLNNQLADAQKRLDMLQAEQLKCKIDFENRMKENMTPAACQLYMRYQEHLKDKIELCEREIEAISNLLDKQIETIKKLKLETKSLETLKTSRLNEYKKEDLKDTEKELEEFVSTSKIMHKTF